MNRRPGRAGNAADLEVQTRRILFNTPLRGTQRENKKGEWREARGEKPKNNETVNAHSELDERNADERRSTGERQSVRATGKFFSTDHLPISRLTAFETPRPPRKIKKNERREERGGKAENNETADKRR